MFITISRFKLSEPFLSCDVSNKSWPFVACLKPHAAVLHTYEPSLSILALVFLVTFDKVACTNI